MNNFTAKITYNEQTIARLSEILSITFRPLARALCVVGGLVMICASLFYPMVSTGSLPLIIVGSLLVTSRNAPARRRGATNYKAIGSQPLTLLYSFSEEGFSSRSTRESSELKYEELIRISYDEEYLYLFKDKRCGYMVELSSISPFSVDELKALIAKGSALKWKPVRKLVKWNIYLLFKNAKDRIG